MLCSLFPLESVVSQGGLLKDQMKQSRFEYGVKGNLGVGGLEIQDKVEQGLYYENEYYNPKLAFSVGFYNLFYLSEKRDFSISAEARYAFTSFSRIQYSESSLIGGDIVYSSRNEYKTNNNSFQLPLKINYHSGRCKFGLGIINAINLQTKVENTYSNIDYKKNEHYTNPTTTIRTNKLIAPKDYNSDAVYLRKFYDKLYVFEFACKVNERMSIGLEYSDYFEDNYVIENNYYQFCYVGEEYSHFGSKQTNALTLSFSYTL